MLRQVRRSLKHVDEWYVEDDKKTVLGKPLGYGSGHGNDMIFKHPDTGEEITACYGTTDGNGKFLRFCQNNKGCVKEGEADIKDKEYAKKAGYYVDF